MFRYASIKSIYDEYNHRLPSNHGDLYYITYDDQIFTHWDFSTLKYLTKLDSKNLPKSLNFHSKMICEEVCKQYNENGSLDDDLLLYIFGFKHFYENGDIIENWGRFSDSFIVDFFAEMVDDNIATVNFNYFIKCNDCEENELRNSILLDFKINTGLKIGGYLDNHIRFYNFLDNKLKKLAKIDNKIKYDLANLNDNKNKIYLIITQ